MSQEQLQPQWQYLIERLGRVAAAMEQISADSDERTRAVLDARARQIAAVAQREQHSERDVEAVMFRLGRQRCGIPTSFVFEALALPACTPLPGAPPHILGLASLRGQILLVADLARLFEFAPADDSEDMQLLILGTERPDLGVVAGGPCRTAMLSSTSIGVPPDLSALPIGSCAQGITTDGLVLLDGQTLLSDPRLFINQTRDERQL